MGRNFWAASFWCWFFIMDQSDSCFHHLVPYRPWAELHLHSFCRKVNRNSNNKKMKIVKHIKLCVSLLFFFFSTFSYETSDEGIEYQPSFPTIFSVCWLTPSEKTDFCGRQNNKNKGVDVQWKKIPENCHLIKIVDKWIYYIRLYPCLKPC